MELACEILHVDGQKAAEANRGSSAADIRSMEQYLRKKAYQNSTIQLDQGFFDDSDMIEAFWLLVVFEKNTGTPLLSCRFYSDIKLITRLLRGDKNEMPRLELSGTVFSPEVFLPGTLFIADRLSGHVSSVLYRSHRAEIFNLFYRRLVATIAPASLLLMVRQERQVQRYLTLGFARLGETLHKGKLHAIVFRDLRDV